MTVTARLQLTPEEARILVDGLTSLEVPPTAPFPHLLTGPLSRDRYQVEVHPRGDWRRVRIRTTAQRCGRLLARLVEIDRRQLLAQGAGRLHVRRAILAGKVWYQRRDPHEFWQTVRDLAVQLQVEGTAGADCEDLAAAYAAERQVEGAVATAVAYRAGPRLWHVVSYSPDEGFVDPSVAGGMGLV